MKERKSTNSKKKRVSQSTPRSGGLASANIFADLGVGDAVNELVKADLVLAIAERVRTAGLTQAAAAARLGTTQPRMSQLLRGHTEDISISKLFELLNKLHLNVTITIAPASASPRTGARTLVSREHLGERIAALGEELPTQGNGPDARRSHDSNAQPRAAAKKKRHAEASMAKPSSAKKEERTKRTGTAVKRRSR